VQSTRAVADGTSDHPLLDQTLAQDVESIERARELSALTGEAPAAVPGYRILKPIGEGKYGSVWLAREQNTGKHVAIKFYTHRRGVDWSLLGREVEKLAVLYTSRNIVGLLAVGWDHDPPYYVMEYLENGSLAARLTGGPLASAEAVRIATRVCNALVHAHGSGILHCDLKPANILLDQDFEPRLCDFGQSRLADENSHALGTLYYMAPEQADLKAVPDARWDVYALGALVFHMLTGTPPFRSEESDRRLAAARTLDERLSIYRQIVRQGPRPAAHRRIWGVDQQLAEIVDRCLASDPAKRFPNAQAVLDRLTARERFRARRPLIVLGLVLPVLLLLGIAPLAIQAMRDAVSTTQRSLTRRALESDVLSANLLAEGIKRDLDDRLTELEAIAADDELRQAVVDFASKPRDERQPLWDLLNGFKKQNDRRWSGLGRSLDDSWFLQDVEGFQRWRDVISMSLDGNYSFRDYFHGGGFHYTESEVPIGVVPIRKRYVCVPYFGTTTQQYLIALSVPVFAPGDDTRVVGVLARSLSLSSLLLDYEKSLRSQRADGVGRKFAIVDSRLPANGKREWKLLAHDWMTKAHLDHLGQSGFEQLRLLDVADEDVLSALEQLVQMTESGEGRHDVDRTRYYIDPISQLDPTTYGGEWLAAFSPVGDTGWVAIVQERKEAALRPVEELESRLYSWAMGAVLLGLGLVAGSWWMIVLLLNERGPRWLKFWRRPPSFNGATTLSLTSKGGDSA
jgi:eukaryotic-like serine/threonine-protein kinase